MASGEKIGRGYPGGPDRSGVTYLTRSEAYEKYGRGGTEARSEALSAGTRRGSPGVLDVQPRPAFDGRVNTSARPGSVR